MSDIFKRGDPVPNPTGRFNDRRREGRIKELEAKNAALKAENAALRDAYWRRSDS